MCNCTWVYIRDLLEYVDHKVEIRGWIRNKRSSGKLAFLQLRDGSGFVQGVVEKKHVGPDMYALIQKLKIESSVIVRGTVKSDERSPSGVELLVDEVNCIHVPEHDYPIAKKEHGVDFLMQYRHLWLRSQKQFHIMNIRHQLIRAMKEFYHQYGFKQMDNPILTGSIGETQDNLFELDYYDYGTVYLCQTGQLYLEAAAMAHGRVFDFGPTFRAEKSSTRKHLIEFWMNDAEVAFYQHDDNMKLQEEFVTYFIQSILDNCQADLKALERDTAALMKITPPFKKITYSEAVELLLQNGFDFTWGKDFGAPEETFLSQHFNEPLFVEKYPKDVKAFYMQPDPDNPAVVLCSDLLAPEGYGEIIGGSERIWDRDLLIQRIKESGLNPKDYQWYIELREYGSVPHSGYGIGLERTLSWICGLQHIRETIPFPRTLYRVYP
ncbi:asparagine--tRNA ligase [candidate division CSSED10-310 bacterium]|uniref:Asparagine--tRNA ligase n=1 Tax=candidate division CSSED10-310 bacterium TaxID=2855610 RepID=A0ABV6YTC4_UNCC1